VRDRVRLVRHDVLAGAPPGADQGFHLICCRNLIIYLKPDTQVQVLRHLLAQMLPGALLCLGEAEWPAHEVERCLQPVDRALRLFRRPPPPPSDSGHVA
jgi:chemotaxis methyl-accepting protein methylase